MNVFRTLSKYGSTEVENYLTESFVFTLRLLFDRSPSIGFDILDSILGISIRENLKVPAIPEFITQEKVEEGYPDITVRFEPDGLAYIEVKHDARLGDGQLEYYKRMLEKSGASVQALVLLTRSKQSSIETNLPKDDFNHVCWYEVHGWLRKCLGIDSVSDYFIQDFLEFLEEKKMSLQRISWEFDNGITSLVDLTSMMEAAVAEVFNGMKMKRTAGWSWRGFYLNEAYFFGVRYDDPTTVVFENNLGTDPDYKKDLVFQDEHFFSLDAGGQFECMTSFLNQCKEEIK